MGNVLTQIRARDLDQRSIDVLALAVGDASPSRLAELVVTYDIEESYSIYLCGMDTAFGLIGFEAHSDETATIRHIAVDRSCQRTGIGRLMINAALEELGFRTLDAETSADAVGFYSSCGFNVKSLGEKYPGVERFECTLRIER